MSNIDSLPSRQRPVHSTNNFLLYVEDATKDGKNGWIGSISRKRDPVPKFVEETPFFSDPFEMLLAAKIRMNQLEGELASQQKSFTPTTPSH